MLSDVRHFYGGLMQPERLCVPIAHPKHKNGKKITQFPILLSSAHCIGCHPSTVLTTTRTITIDFPLNCPFITN